MKRYHPIDVYSLPYYLALSVRESLRALSEGESKKEAHWRGTFAVYTKAKEADPDLTPYELFHPLFFRDPDPPTCVLCEKGIHTYYKEFMDGLALRGQESTPEKEGPS